MGNASFNQDWYGMQAKVLAQSDDRVVVDYGCKGRGIVKNYNLFEGMVLRFFPTFSEEIHNIYDAMKLRGIALSWKNVFTRPMLILEAITIPIVMRSASIAEELSASAVTRGIDNPAQRTSFIQLKVHAKDWMVLCFFLVAFVVLFFCKYQIYGRI